MIDALMVVLGSVVPIAIIVGGLYVAWSES